MDPSKSENHSSPGLNRNAWLFALTTGFLATMGVGIISPVVPFIVQPYLHKEANLAVVVGFLVSVYAICQFAAAPGLGALSDRFGRRLIIMICLFGSVIGYILFGVGGSLWVLFLGRIIDGLTGGNLSILHAYLADITPRDRRGQYFGKLGAATGVGFICGPLVGAVAANFGYSAPLFVGAGLTAANLLLGYFYMPESLPLDHRKDRIGFKQLNPFRQLADVLALSDIRRLLIVIFLHAVPFAVLAANFAVLGQGVYRWQPGMIGALLFAFGIQDAVNQGWIVPRSLGRWGDRLVASGGLCLEAIGYGLISVSSRLVSVPLLIAGFVIFGFGESSFGPAMSGWISRLVNPGDQGRMQGSHQALQALARIIGPLAGGGLYSSLGPASPYVFGVACILLAWLIVLRLISTRKILTMGTRGG